MRFVDEATVYVKSGDGGKGQMSFRRERFIARGGPDGGDGGDGGAIIFEASERRNTLVDYRYHPHIKGNAGQPGGKYQMTGARGKPKHCLVPVGTYIYDAETDELLADLGEVGQTYTIPGGRGGLGNIHFKSSTNRTPRYAQPGEPGTELTLRMELKLIADVGLLGFPNAGKSTFLGKVSAARPRVADYPFTTLVPQLGVVRLEDEQTFVLADIPGLIEGASEGHGLGHTFLKHIERCACYIHLIAIDPHDPLDPVERYDKLNHELKQYGEAVSKRAQVVVLNKTDLADPEEVATWVEALEARTGAKVFAISGITGDGVSKLVGAVWQVVQLMKKPTDSGDSDG